MWEVIPEITLARVDLPLPDSPEMPIICFRSTSKEISFNISIDLLVVDLEFETV